MKAWVQDRYGSTDVLEFTEVERPAPREREVLVRVHAAAVNAADWHLMRGDPYVARLALGLRRPKERIRGRDFAGRVEAVGPGVTGLRPGDEVFGEAPGSFAEYVCAPETATERKPAGLTFEQAAAIPLAGNTALMGLRDLGKTRPGMKVLVNGASGGVGTFAVQLAKAFGAEVTGVCSARNAQLVLGLGADRVIDYARDDFTTGQDRYDLVFDLVGNRSLSALRRVLSPAGTLVLSGGGVFEGGSVFGPMGLIVKGQLLSLLPGRRLHVLTAVPRRENLAALRELAETGGITPVVERTYPLAEAPRALRYVEEEHARAKVVLSCPPPSGP
ncbi:NAD(P)-dependent alcohol dehydrogenase [Streptomyces narbonensis]|uniref:NAD(P)-dependent alcohol dehydrogenase n=1 Tax=Streptomyces narbonensis TaxID=67333 RepID=UPI0016722F16|nr:NAD(P)-dependent alcohol dehydrogenase [Streptomyces narbonensis]GGW11322.1 NADPH:quinone reductase [Streptomyces narbonensis]